MKCPLAALRLGLTQNDGYVKLKAAVRFGPHRISDNPCCIPGDSLAQTFDYFTSWIATRRWLTVAVILLISAGAIFGHINPGLVRDYFTEVELLAEDSDKTLAPIDLESVDPENGRAVARLRFLSDAILIVEMEDAFSPRGAEALRHVEQQLEAKDFIRSVQWMDEIPTMNIFGLPEPLLPQKQASQQKFDAARAKALKNPFIKGIMMSEDLKTLVFMVNYDRLFLESDEQAISGLRIAAEEAATAFPDVEMDFSVTGSTPMWLTAMKSHDANQFWFQAIGYGMIALMSLILFRGFMSMMIVALAPIIGVFWTIGYCNFLGYEHNPFMEVILPILVSLVGLTDGVHLMVTTRKLRASGLSTLESSSKALSQVGLACALTSLTTAIGFGSLVLADHEFIQQFGVACVIGVILSFVAVVTVIPLACGSRLGKNIHIGLEKSLVDQNLDRISHVVLWVLPRKKWVSVVAIAATVFLVGISLTLRPDERISNSMPASSEAAMAFAKLDKALGGLEQSKVMIRWDKESLSDLRNSRSSDEVTAERVAVIKQANDLLQKEPLIGHPLSIVEMIDSMPGQGDTVARSSLVELLPPSLKQTFFRPYEQKAEIAFRVQDLGISKYGPVFKRIETGLSEIEERNPNYRLSLTGPAIYRWKDLYQIVVDLAASLGTATVIIFVVLSLVYRSLRIGLISLVPNLFPLAVAGGYLVFTGQALEIVTVCAFTVCLGIAVDDTIHFLTRYEEERSLHGNTSEAITKAFSSVGTALIMTTIVLVTGFSTVLFSDSRDHFMFASMGAITLTAALFADLVFLPGLLAYFIQQPTADDEPLE